MTNSGYEYHFGAPYASAMRSMVYLCDMIYIIGTPGTFLILLLRSLSQVATIKHLCCLILSTMQSSAYVPLWLHFSLSNLGSFDIFNAILYFTPNFSSSPTTQSVIYGMHLPSKQSILALKMSSLF